MDRERGDYCLEPSSLASTIVSGRVGALCPFIAMSSIETSINIWIANFEVEVRWFLFTQTLKGVAQDVK